METDSITIWFNRLADGDQQAANQIWQRYWSQMVGHARTKLAKLPLRASDEEDVALSAMHSFFQGVAADRFPNVDDREDLRALLLLITTRNTVDLGEFTQSSRLIDYSLAIHHYYLPEKECVPMTKVNTASLFSSFAVSLLCSAASAASPSAMDFLLPAMGGPTEIKKPNEVKVSAEVVQAADAQDAMNAAVQANVGQIEDNDFESQAVRVQFGSGWGYVATGSSQYRASSNVDLSRISKRKAYVIAFTIAKKKLAETLNGISVSGQETVRQTLATVSLPDQETMANIATNTDECRRQAVQMMLRGFVVYEVKDATDQDTIYVSIATSPKTVAAVGHKTPQAINAEPRNIGQDELFVTMEVNVTTVPNAATWKLFQDNLHNLLMTEPSVKRDSFAVTSEGDTEYGKTGYYSFSWNHDADKKMYAYQREGKDWGYWLMLIKNFQPSTEPGKLNSLWTVYPLGQAVADVFDNMMNRSYQIRVMLLDGDNRVLAERDREIKAWQELSSMMHGVKSTGSKSNRYYLSPFFWGEGYYSPSLKLEPFEVDIPLADLKNVARVVAKIEPIQTSPEP